MSGRRSNVLNNLKNDPAKSKSGGGKRKLGRGLDALAIAEREVPQKLGVKKHRLGDEDDYDSRRKRGYDEEVDDDDGPSKRRRTEDSGQSDAGSDSEGNEWTVGKVDSENDSEIDSDNAFGSSDEERFEGYSFRASSTRKNSQAKPKGGKRDLPQSESNDEDGASDAEMDDDLGVDAVDLAAAWDMNAEESEEEKRKTASKTRKQATHEDTDSDDASSTGSESEEEADDESDLSISEDEATDNAWPKTGGIPGKLDVPLSKREQDRLDRTAAYQKSKETLDRWIDTVKANRRAEHLSFPLPEVAPLQDSKIVDSKPRTDLESTIQNILIESGLATSNGKDTEKRIQEFEELEANKLSIHDLQERRNELRKARELLFREEVRAKRIKKIKSKAYRRVHRKEREKVEQREREALAAAGVDMEDGDRERADRLRAEMRMGAKHRESKWAKSVKQTGRANWDEDTRSGIAEQARRKEELQRRIEGKRVENEDYLGSSSSESEEDDVDPFDNEIGSEDEAQMLRRKLGKLAPRSTEEEELAGPHAKLLSMKFMQNAEASRKAANEAEIKKLDRELAGEESASEIGDEEAGRQRFGKDDTKPSDKHRPIAPRQEFEEPDSENENSNLIEADEIDIRVNGTTDKKSKQPRQPSSRRNGIAVPSEPTNKEDDVNPWLTEGTKQSRKKKNVVDRTMDITLIDNTAQAPAAETDNRQKKSVSGRKGASQPRQNFRESGDHSSDDDDSHVPVLLQNEELVKRAFAGDEVLEAFTKEKHETIADEDDKVVEDTLPGWGSWTGSGLTKKEKKEARAQRSFKTVEGIKPSKRKDAKLDRVIINEKRVRKNTKYLASQLPHPFESRQQYERSLRLPIGPEWTTKEVFQKSTQPRIMVKQGVIKPIQRPQL
ncbi:predicted protein [Uncinocarpus reesii 1704]|uniref:Uncharacterized protein n=1 Tax=Uncinocarpus reesii (strain UAMH 1704) TaxID=336963 RepID=C4JVG8_UNCRE|nr:uncharacterized protein UREG_06560 [Uncinocarpus reesii 1704]EEP81695.1 predicted protein [Uncinocarpus reesii 1704]